MKGWLAGQRVKEGRQKNGFSPERKKRRGFHKMMDCRREGGMRIRGRKKKSSRDREFLPFLMMMFSKERPSLQKHLLFIETLEYSSLVVITWLFQIRGRVG